MCGARPPAPPTRGEKVGRSSLLPGCGHCLQSVAEGRVSVAVPEHDLVRVTSERECARIGAIRDEYGGSVAGTFGPEGPLTGKDLHEAVIGNTGVTLRHIDRYRTECSSIARDQESLRPFAAADGEKLAEYKLPAPPVWDGMAAARGRLFISTVNGDIICMK